MMLMVLLTSLFCSVLVVVCEFLIFVSCQSFILRSVMVAQIMWREKYVKLLCFFVHLVKVTAIVQILGLPELLKFFSI